MSRFGAVLLALSLAACAQSPEPPPPAAPVELNGSTFRLVSYRGQPVPGDGKYLLSFDAKSLQANFCNRLFGAYQLADDRLSARLAGTKMFCTAPQVMEMEQGFAELLDGGTQMRREAHLLSLLDDRGVAIFEYQVYMD